MAWSLTHIDTVAVASLFQVYPIHLSVLLSINRQQLSLFDVNYAFTISSSPLMVFLVFTSICDLF